MDLKMILHIRQKIWKEQSLKFMQQRTFIPQISRKTIMETVFWNMQQVLW